MRDDGQIQPAKVTHFTQQGLTIKGVIHAGMNDGEEVYSYKDLGIEHILGFEPLPFAAQKARDDHGVYVSELALSDKTGTAELIVTKGDGKGSSIFEPILESEEVKKNWVDNGIIVDHIKITTTRFDEWVDNQPKAKFDLANFDCLVLDTQGNEWEVLHGAGEYLKHFKFLSIELSAVPVYDGEHSGQEVVDWLTEQGFTQDSEIQSHNDVFFVRSDIKPTSDRVYRGLA